MLKKNEISQQRFDGEDYSITVINKQGENPIIIKTHSEEYIETEKNSFILDNMIWMLLVGFLIFFIISFFNNDEFRATIIQALNTLLLINIKYLLILNII